MGIDYSKKVFTFGEVQFICNFLLHILFSYSINEALPNLRLQRFIVMFSSRNFIVLNLTTMSTIYFCINFRLWC